MKRGGSPKQPPPTSLRFRGRELDAYGKRDEQVVGKSGCVFRVRSHAFWDMDEWASGIQVNVKVYALRGLRSVWPYKASATRGGPSDPVPTRPDVG